MKSDNTKVVSLDKTFKEIKSIVAEAIRDSYGVSEIATSEGKKGKEENITVKLHSKNHFSVEVHVIMATGVKITESLFECQKIIKYRLDKKFPKLCRSVDIYADSISLK